MITAPVHSPNGCKNSSHNHIPNGFSASITLCIAFRAAAIKSNTVGNACSTPHFAIGSSTSLRNHNSKFPTSDTIGFTEIKILSKLSNKGEKSKSADHSFKLSDA